MVFLSAHSCTQLHVVVLCIGVCAFMIIALDSYSLLTSRMLKQSLEDSIAADTKDMDEEKAAKAGAEEKKAVAEGDLASTTKDLACRGSGCSRRSCPILGGRVLGRAFYWWGILDVADRCGHVLGSRAFRASALFWVGECTEGLYGLDALRKLNCSERV
jgi:hypothetical protein